MSRYCKIRGDTLKRLRKEAKHTQQSLQDVSGVRRELISRIERCRGRRAQVERDTALKLMAGLNVPSRRLLAYHRNSLDSGPVIDLIREKGALPLARKIALRTGRQIESVVRHLERVKHSDTVTITFADRFACALGFHPTELWGRDWWVGLSD